MTRSTLDTPVGVFHLAANALGLAWASFTEPRALKVEVESTETDSRRAEAHLARARAQFTEYFRGELKEFDLAIAPGGTPFQHRVWDELGKIPYGETISYRELARRVGKPKAFRAVGAANGRNPLCVIIPCHRVVASDGSLGGYTGGLEFKTKLLELENPARAAESNRPPASMPVGAPPELLVGQ